MSTQEQNRVAVTGANGFIASYIVKKLLEKGYYVVATVRDPTNKAKIAHLLEFENASTNLLLVGACLQDNKNDFIEAFKGVTCVFHTASPLTFEGGENAIVQPAINGTKKVLEAVRINSSTIKNLIFTSSMSSVKTGNYVSSDYVYDKSNWSNVDKMRETENWYSLSKTLAEQLVVEFENDHPHINISRVCPTVVQGPPLSKQYNFIQQQCIVEPIVNSNYSVGQNKFFKVIDVRDVADLHILSFEKNIKNGRILAIGDAFTPNKYSLTLQKLCKELEIHSGDFEIIEDAPEIVKRHSYLADTTEAEELLGRPFYNVEECLKDSLLSLRNFDLI